MTKDNKEERSDRSDIGDRSDRSDIGDISSKHISPISLITYITEYNSLFSGSILGEVLIHFWKTKNEPITYDKLAKKLDVRKASLTAKIHQNKNLFHLPGVRSKEQVLYVSDEGIRYINEKIEQEIQKKKIEEDFLRQQELNDKQKLNKKEELLTESKNFFEAYKKDILREGNVLIVDFENLSEYSVLLSDELLYNPEETFQTIELAIEELGLIKNARVRVKNLPNSAKVLIEDIRSTHLNNFISIKAKIIQSSDARPQAVNAKFDCPSCGTIISVLQLEKKFREPSRCSCGRRGGFNLLSKELVDTARFVIQDLQEDSESTSPRKLNCFVKEDLASKDVLNKMLKAGNDILLNGVLKEVPVPLKQGGLSTRFELALEVNYVELAEEEIDLSKLTEEEIEAFESLANRIDDKGIGELTPSFAPVVINKEYEKQALILYPCNQLNRPGVDEERNKSNVLFIGDPSCVVKDTYVTLRDGTFTKITNFKDYKSKSILLNKRLPSDKEESKVSKFWHYKNYPTKKILTETGKELICSHNHPVWIKRKLFGKTKKMWVRADSIIEGDKVKVMTKIRCKKKRYIKLKEPKNIYPNSKKIKIPYCNEDVGLLFGMITGDGWVNKYTTNICYPESEKIIGKIYRKIIKEQFGLDCRTILKPFSKKKRFIGEHEIKEKEKVYYDIINSKSLAEIFKCEKARNKRIPEIIMESKDSVLSNFLKGLFSTDGCCFITKSKNRSNKIYVQLKSASHKLLLDVQLALLRFGIQARINHDNLEIKKIEDVKRFKKYIGFIQDKKQNTLVRVKNIKIEGRKHLTYEKIINIKEDKVQDVYDITVPKHHRFISNGIISHNTSKSVLVKFLEEISIGSLKVVGGGTSAVGITAAANKDEFLGGWMINPGALVLAKDMLFLEELNTMSGEEKSKIQDAMESQYVNVTKAGTSAVFKVRTGIVSCANPIHGHFRYSPNKKEVLKQFDIPTPILSRFDTVFLFRDIRSKSRDFEISLSMKKRKTKSLQAEFEKDFLKKFFFYTRSRKEPSMGEDFQVLSAKVYAIIRHLTGEETTLNARVSEAIDRMCVASAKLRGSEIVEEKDLERVIPILANSYFALPDYSVIKMHLDRDNEDKKKGIFGIKEEIINLMKNNPDETLTLSGLEEKFGKEKELRKVMNDLKQKAVVYEYRKDAWRWLG